MRGAVETGDGIRAWLFLRCVPEYEAAWRARAGPPAALNTATEPGGQDAFPIRVQTRADRKRRAVTLVDG